VIGRYGGSSGFFVGSGKASSWNPPLHFYESVSEKDLDGLAFRNHEFYGLLRMSRMTLTHCLQSLEAMKVCSEVSPTPGEPTLSLADREPFLL